LFHLDFCVGKYVDTLSGWVKVTGSLIHVGIQKLNRLMSTMATSSFNVHDATKYMFNMYVVVPADKAPSDIVFICKRHSIDCSTIELDIDN